MINPFSLVSIFGTTVKKTDKENGKSVIATATGDIESGLDAEVYGHHGFISRPSSKTVGIRLRIGSLSIVIAAYTYGVEPPVNEGATKVYSTDEEGTEQASHVLDADGVHIFNGGDDWAVRFSALQTAFNALKSSYNDLVGKYNTHVHTGVTTGSGSSGTTAAVGTASTADISGAKVEEILIP